MDEAEDATSVEGLVLLGMYGTTSYSASNGSTRQRSLIG
jgi:hypothetical protein